jgi:hypothetical protein
LDRGDRSDRDQGGNETVLDRRGTSSFRKKVVTVLSIAHLSHSRRERSRIGGELNRENQGEGGNQTVLDRRKSTMFLQSLVKYFGHTTTTFVLWPEFDRSDYYALGLNIC